MDKTPKRAGTESPYEDIRRPALRAIGVQKEAPTFEDMKAPTEEGFRQLMAYLMENQLKPSSPFVLVYLSDPEAAPGTEHVRFFCGIGSDHEIRDAEASIQPYTVPGGRYLKAMHKGPYEGMEEIYCQLDAHIKTHHLRITGLVWEEYVVHQGMEPDATKWITYIYYPVAAVAEEGV